MLAQGDWKSVAGLNFRCRHRDVHAVVGVLHDLDIHIRWHGNDMFGKHRLGVGHEALLHRVVHRHDTTYHWSAELESNISRVQRAIKPF